MEQIDIKKIKYHAQKLDRLCDRRNLIINQTTRRHHKKKKGNKKNKQKKNKECSCGNYIMKKKSD